MKARTKSINNLTLVKDLDGPAGKNSFSICSDGKFPEIYTGGNFPYDVRASFFARKTFWKFSSLRISRIAFQT
jgi:hypothetical protein